jgi:hypothetical protein
VTPPGRMVAWGYFEGVERHGLSRRAHRRRSVYGGNCARYRPG